MTYRQINCAKDETYGVRCVPGGTDGRTSCQQHCDNDHLTETGEQQTFRSHGQFNVSTYMHDIQNRMPTMGITAASGDTNAEMPDGAQRRNDIATFAGITQRAKDIIQNMK